MDYREAEAIEKANVDEALAKAKEEISKQDFDAYSVTKEDLKTAVSNWNTAISHVSYEGFLKTDNPIMTAIRTLYITSRRIKEETDETSGKVIGISIKENSKTRIDIEDFMDFAALDKEWLRDSARLLALLQLRKTNIYKMTPAEIAKNSDIFIRALKKKKEGETPDSNTKITDLLQKIADATIFEDNGHGLNKHKCTVKDIYFIEDCAHQFDPKSPAGIKSLKVRTFQTVMVSALRSMLTGEGYTVKNAKVKFD